MLDAETTSPAIISNIFCNNVDKDGNAEIVIHVLRLMKNMFACVFICIKEI